MGAPEEGREDGTNDSLEETGRAVPALGREATRGMLWSTLANFTARGLGFLTTILLTRRMAKQDYGRANAAITISSTIAFFGFSSRLSGCNQHMGSWSGSSRPGVESTSQMTTADVQASYPDKPGSR